MQMEKKHIYCTYQNQFVVWMFTMRKKDTGAAKPPLRKTEAGPEQNGFSTRYMDPNADPRADFYSYAAGKWLLANPAPPKDRPVWNCFGELYDRNLSQLRKIAEDCSGGQQKSQDQASGMVGNFYSSAMDTARIEKLGFKPIEDLLLSISDAKSRSDISRLIPLLHMSGVDAFFSSSAYPDQKDSGTYIFYIEQGGLSLPDRDYYLSPKFSKLRDEYREHIAKMFMLNGVSAQQAAINADSVLDIEASLARASRTRVELRDPEKNYNRVGTSRLESRYKSIAFSEYLPEMGVRPCRHVIVGQPEFMNHLDSELNGRDVEQLKAYLSWKVIHAYAPFLHSDADSENFKMFGVKIKGQQEQQPRWKRAIGIIDGSIGEALGKIYVERHFDSAANLEAREMVTDIIAAFREKLRRTEWMSEETRAKALDKLDRLNVKIGHPAKFRDYSGLEIRPDEYVGNIRRSIAFETRRENARVGKPVDRSEWEMTPPTVNAYYSPTENEIVFPAGILQPPMFDHLADPAVNYGAIGAIIGHEITHGFDDNGRLYGADGNLHEWWTARDRAEFKKKAESVARLYGKQEVLPGTFLNGELTLGENIADMGGIKVAYDALQRRLAKDPQANRTIDGLTQSQRFFIAYSQSWREVITKEELMRRITTDPHSPAKYRATLPVANDPDFDNAFPPKSAQDSDALPKDSAGVW